MLHPRVDLSEFFRPNGVALIGSIDRTADEARVRADHDHRWGTDNWHLVNPKGGTLGSIPIYTVVADIPAPVSLAVINTPAPTCADLVRQSGAAGIRFALVFSAGFSEVGDAGAELERELTAAGREAGVRIVGPNTNTNAFEIIADAPYQSGRRIGVVSQSGHNGRPIVQGVDLGLGFTRLIPTGNEVDIDICDFIEHLALDSETSVIAAYVEGFRDGSRLREALTLAQKSNTPIVMMKIGTTAAGARMAQTHTGHMVGSDAIIDALLERYGVIRVRDLDELLDTAALLARINPETGAKVALYSISGGSGTLMAEVAEMAGVPLAKLTTETEAKLRRVIPGHLTVSNPIDNGGTFVINNSEAVRQQVLRDILDDGDVDLLVVGVTGSVPPMTDLLANDILALAGTTVKPMIATWNSPRTDDPAYDTLVHSGVPLFRSFRNCFGSLAAFNRHRQTRLELRNRRPNKLSEQSRNQVLATLGPTRSGILDPMVSENLLTDAGINFASQILIDSRSEAAEVASLASSPSAMKVASTDIGHKSDHGLVILNVAPEDIEAEYSNLMIRSAGNIPDETLMGVVVQTMAARGVEVLVGVVTDPVLGPAIVLGMGGVNTELLADRTLRPLPIDREDAHSMIASLRGSGLLRGYRGQVPADVDALVDLIQAVAALATTLGPRLIECELNPVVVHPIGQGATAVDALFVIRDRQEKP